jgi:hypothetical protein
MNDLEVTPEPRNGDHDIKSDVIISTGHLPKDLDKLPTEKESGSGLLLNCFRRTR